MFEGYHLQPLPPMFSLIKCWWQLGVGADLTVSAFGRSSSWAWVQPYVMYESSTVYRRPLLHKLILRWCLKLNTQTCTRYTKQSVKIINLYHSSISTALLRKYIQSLILSTPYPKKRTILKWALIFSYCSDSQALIVNDYVQCQKYHK